MYLVLRAWAGLSSSVGWGIILQSSRVYTPPPPPLRDTSVMMMLVIMMLVAVEVAVVVIRPEEDPCGVSVQERALSRSCPAGEGGRAL